MDFFEIETPNLNGNLIILTAENKANSGHWFNGSSDILENQETSYGMGNSSNIIDV